MTPQQRSGLRSHEPSTIAAWTLAICRALRQTDIDPAPLLQQAGIDYSYIERYPDSRIPVRLMTHLWQLAEQASANPAFGLVVAQQVQPMHFRALGLLMVASDCMLTVLEKIGRYHAMISDSVNIRVIHHPDRVGFVIDPLAGVPISPLSVDAFFATLVQFARQFSGHENPLLAIDLIRSLPAQASVWTAFFAVAPQFSQATNCLWFNRAVVSRSDLPGDEQLAMTNESQVQKYLQAMQALSWHDKVVNSLRAMLEHQEPTLADIAGLFHVSERSLRRHLQQDGYQFRELLSQARADVAAFYLCTTDEPVGAIALRLRFSDGASFAKAFQRWYAMSPSRYRATQPVR